MNITLKINCSMLGGVLVLPFQVASTLKIPRSRYATESSTCSNQSFGLPERTHNKELLSNYSISKPEENKFVY